VTRKGLTAVWRDAIRDSELPSTARLVAHTLSTYANGAGVCHPSRATIAAGAGLSSGLRAVDAALARLEQDGFLEISRSAGRSSHGYALLLPATAHEARRSEWATAQQMRGETAHDVRHSRDATAHLATPNRAFRASNRAPDASKSVESAESERGAALRRAAPRVKDTCVRCSDRRDLDGDSLLCDDCAEAAA
jgi:hypothetical protein